MKLGKALRIIMVMWNITGYRLSKVSGIDRSTIGKLIRGDYQSASWDKVEQIANALEEIDPIAKGAFMAALLVPNDAYPHTIAGEDTMPAEPLFSIVAEAIEIAKEAGYLNLEAIEAAGLIIEESLERDDRPNFDAPRLASWIAFRIYDRHRTENQQACQEDDRDKKA